MIAIVDYGMGNVRSLRNALAYIDVDAEVTSEPGRILAADRLILPGVGAFGDAMKSLRQLSLPEALEEAVFRRGKPFLGICLGLQLLAESSTEHGVHTGLGWFEAEVKRFDLDSTDLKVPHMGWNHVCASSSHPLFAKLPANSRDFYFVHSFHIELADSANVTATSVYGYQFAAAIGKDNIFATQFHPEKSQDNGIQMLRNFADWTP
jgi:glutamine amidotransferase